MDSNTLTRKIRHHLQSGSDWSEPNDRFAFEGLERQLQVADPPQRQALIKACQALISDPELQVRSGIVALLPEIAADLDANWLLNQLEQQAPLFVGVAPEGALLSQATLDREILLALSLALRPQQARVLSRLRQEVLKDPDWGRCLLPSLAKLDSDWLQQNARKVIPHRMVAVLTLLDPQARRAVIRQLAPWPPEILNKISPAYWQQFPPQEAQELKRLMAGAIANGTK